VLKGAALLTPSISLVAVKLINRETPDSWQKSWEGMFLIQSSSSDRRSYDGNHFPARAHIPLLIE
jgi:hypothetical protein